MLIIIVIHAGCFTTDRHTKVKNSHLHHHPEIEFSEARFEANPLKSNLTGCSLEDCL